MNSGFYCVPSFIKLKNKGLFYITIIKKRFHLSKHKEVKDAIDDIQGEYVGTIRERRVTGAEYIKHVYMVAVKDLLHLLQ